MEARRKKPNFQTKLRQVGGTTVAPIRHRTGQSKRLGHPSRNIVRPKKFMTTSSSDKEIIKRRTKKQLEPDIDIDKDISEIRNVISNKDNETTNITIQNPQFTINNPSLQSVQSTEQLYSPPNVATGTLEQNSVPEKTYSELLPPSSTQGSNFYAAGISTFSKSTSNRLASYTAGNNSIFPQSTLTVQEYSSQNEQGFYELPFPNAPVYQPAATLRLQTQVASTITPSQESEPIYGHSQPYITMATRPDKEPIPITPAIRTNADTSGNGKENKRPHNETLLESLHRKIDNLITKENYEDLKKKLDKLLRKRIHIMPPKPPSFPLASIEQVQDFDHATEEEYELAVEYFRFLGGFTLHDAVKFCLKEALTDETVQHYSAWGERGNQPLSTTNLIKGIYGNKLHMNASLLRLLIEDHRII